MDKNDSRPLYLQLADEMRKRILGGQFADGGLLANERSLALELGISRVTVRKALDVLKEQGLIYKIRGKGIFAGPPALHGSAQRDIVLHKRTIGIACEYYIERSHMAQMVNSAISCLSEHNYFPMRLNYLDARYQRNVFSYYKDFLKGVILSPSPIDTEIEAIRANVDMLKEHGIEAVIIGHEVHGGLYDYVKSDDKAGMKDAVGHLVSNGHQRIAYVCNNRAISTRRERYDGYVEAMSLNRLERIVLDSGCIGSRKLSHRERGFQLGLMALDGTDRPTAIIAENDMTAIGIIDALYERGVEFPADFELIGFGNDIESSMYDQDHFSMLSTVDIPRNEIGRRAAELVMERINFPGRERCVASIPVRLLHRGTTRCGTAS